MRRTENASYQPSRTVSHTVTPKGDDPEDFDDCSGGSDGALGRRGRQGKKIVVPPSAEVLKGVHDMVAGIVGFNEQRGDQITVESLPFENTLEAEPPMSATSRLEAESPGWTKSSR